MDSQGYRRLHHHFIHPNEEEDERKKRRRNLTKHQLVKRLRFSFNDWPNKSNRIFDRRTNLRESTIALLKRAKTMRHASTSSSPPSPPVSIDPITRELISNDHQNVFTFKRGQAIVRMDALALIEYMLSTGDYCDPESRIEFDENSLKRLDEIGLRLGKPSILKARYDLEAKLADHHFMRDALCGLERVCGEYVSQMFDIIESINEKPDNEQSKMMEEAHVQLLTYVIPEFQSNFSQLVSADPAFAKQSAMQFESFLKGPPNRPVKSTPIHILVMELYRGAISESMNRE